ncbi:MAG: phage gp6-like head-tail connector protein [Ammonifex sp.]|jgi:uncharacterized phage protein (predicted DNA packaging)|nr:MAG: phage gp6-like head-tail connector protein [Ammonifex sp.]
MVITLEEAKQYLKVDVDEENALIVSFIAAAEDIVEGILRQPLSDFAEVPEVVRQAIFFATAQFYELREALLTPVLVETIKRLLFAYRKESW